MRERGCERVGRRGWRWVGKESGGDMGFREIPLYMSPSFKSAGYLKTRQISC